MKTIRHLSLALTVGLMMAGLAACSSSNPKDVKISKAEATKIALARVPNGTIKESA
jgi:uncharacterized membrane protein YkoI